jgi:hypothetical protein
MAASQEGLSSMELVSSSDRAASMKAFGGEVVWRNVRYSNSICEEVLEACLAEVRNRPAPSHRHAVSSSVHGTVAASAVGSVSLGALASRICSPAGLRSRCEPRTRTDSLSSFCARLSGPGSLWWGSDRLQAGRPRDRSSITDTNNAFFHRMWAGSTATEPPIQWVRGSRGPGRDLTTRLHLQQRLRMCGAMTLLSECAPCVTSNRRRVSE